MGNGKPFGFSNKIDDPSFDDVVLEFGRAIIVMVPDLVPVAFSRTTTNDMVLCYYSVKYTSRRSYFQ